MHVTNTQRQVGTRWRFLLACIVVVLVALSLCGCKYTDVLTEHIEDPENGEVDPNVEPLYVNVMGAEVIPDLANTVLTNSDDVDKQAQVLPHYDPNAPDNGETPQLRHEEQTPEENEASEGEEESGQEATNDGQGTAEGEQKGEQQSAEEDLTESDEPEESTDAGDGGTTVIVDDQGTTSDSVPRGTVAAVGQYATITQMLGGAGGLVACDQSWYDTVTSLGAFPNELEGVSIAWTGDGTADGSCDIDALINEIRPSIILWDGSAPALTADDRAQIEEAGITIQTVPTLGSYTTEDVNIKQAVIEVAAVLSGVSTVQYDPTAMRDSYVSLHDQALQYCYDANGGSYAYKATDGSSPHLYQDTPAAGFDSPNSAITTCVYVDSLWNPGVSSVTVHQQATTLSGVITLAHDGESLDVSDGVALSAYTASDNYMLIDYYLQFGGIVNNAYNLAQPEINGKPYILMAGSTDTFGSSGNFSQRDGVGSALWYNNGDSGVAENWRKLSDPAFPAVLVNGEEGTEIAEAISASASKGNGLYNMGSPYDIYVVPSGVSGSWAKGNVESFLVAPWALRMRSVDLSLVEPFVSGFYSAFYRVDDWQSIVTTWSSTYPGA